MKRTPWLRAACAAGGCFPSDIRLKRDIVLLGRLNNGLNLYRYRYLWSDQLYVGVMAQEVAVLNPKAIVRDAAGYMHVNYNSLGLRMQTWQDWAWSNRSTAALAKLTPAFAVKRTLMNRNSLSVRSREQYDQLS
jgi:hypothetical protein